MKAEKAKKSRKPKALRFNFWYTFVKVTGYIPAWLWLRPKILRYGERAPKRIKGGVLLSANHVTYIDPIIMMCAFATRRIYSIATKDIARTKMRKFFFTVANCIFIDKEKFSMASLREICDVLKHDQAVMIFPESSIDTKGEIREYKSGFVLMSVLSKKPILPVCIVPGDRWYNRVRVVIGEPIDAASLCSPIPAVEEMDAIAHSIQALEQEMWLFGQNDKKGRKKRQ